jgi:hypothetical protein
LEEHRQEIRNAHRQARSAQRELDRANQGGNQVIPLACREFDGNHRGLRHTLGEMTTLCDKCGALHFLEERATSSSCANPQFTFCCAQGKVTLPRWHPHQSRSGGSLQVTKRMQNTFVNTSALTTMH